MKKIDVITKYFLPVQGGIENSIYQTYSRLTKEGFEVNIHTAKDSYTQKNVYKKKEQLEELNVFRYKTNLLGFFPSLKIFKTDYLILHNFNLFPHSIIVLCASLLKVINKKDFIFIITPHGGMTPNYSNLAKGEGLVKRIANKLLVKLFVNYNCDSVRASSVWEKKALLRLGVKKSLIVIIPDGIENEAYLRKLKVGNRIKSIKKQYDPYIIQIGKIYPTKKYETTIKALKETNEEINLIIIGRSVDSKYKFKLIRLVRKLELENRVRFIEEVSVLEKYYLFRKAQLFVLSSEWESFGRVFYEALSQGIPVAVSDKTAPAEHIGKDVVGNTFDNDDENDLARIINSNVTKQNANRVKKTNSKFAKNFDWNNIANLLRTNLSNFKN
jgi:glycosyltransferase involved in cell wall biosynthesis